MTPTTTQTPTPSLVKTGLKRLKLNLRLFLAGHIVAMVTYCATKLTATCSPKIGQFVDTMIVALTDKESLTWQLYRSAIEK